MPHDVFISYSRKDEGVVDRLRSALDRIEVAYWLDTRNIELGDPWGQDIEEAITASRAMIVVISEHAAKSKRVLNEVVEAENLGVKLLPIYLEPIAACELRLNVTRYHSYNASEKELGEALSEFVKFVELALTGPNTQTLFFPESNKPIPSLLYNANKYWIEGFLSPALKLGQSVPLPMPFKVFDSDGEEVGSEKDWYHAPVPAPRVLIVGPSGAGKTIVMLEGVRDLLRRYQDPKQKSKLIPVVLSVDSWYVPLKSVDEQRSVEDWIVRQLFAQYGIPIDDGKQLVRDEPLVYFIDGLEQIGRGFVADPEALPDDEHAEQVRGRFDRKLAEFDTKGKRGIQITDSDRPGVGLLEAPFRRIEMGHITSEAALEWLTANGMPILAEYFQKNPDLLDEVRQHHFHLELAAAVLGHSTSGDIRAIFAKPRAAFIPYCLGAHFQGQYDRQLGNLKSAATKAKRKNVDRLKLPFGFDELEDYMGNIAQYLRQRGSAAVFRMDELSPGDLDDNLKKSYRRWLFLSVMAAIMVLGAIGPTIGIAYAWLARGKPGVALAHSAATFVAVGIFGGSIAAAAYAYVSMPGTIGFGKWSVRGDHFIRSLALGIGFGVGRATTCAAAPIIYGIAYENDPLSKHIGGGAVEGISSLIGAWLIFLLFFHFMEDDPMKIRIMEKLEPNFGFWWVSLLFAVGVALMVALSSGHFVIEEALAFTPSLFALIMVFFGRQSTSRVVRVRPNQGIRHALKMGLSWTVVVTLFGSLAFGFAFGQHDLTAGIEAAFEAVSFMLAFFFLDGLTVVKYAALRLTLNAARLVPLALGSMLELATGVGFVRRVGGGHVFANRSVFEHLLDDVAARRPSAGAPWQRP